MSLALRSTGGRVSVSVEVTDARRGPQEMTMSNATKTTKTPKYTVRPLGGTAWAECRTIAAARRAARKAIDAGLQQVVIVDRDGTRYPIAAEQA